MSVFFLIFQFCYVPLIFAQTADIIIDNHIPAPANFSARVIFRNMTSISEEVNGETCGIVLHLQWTSIRGKNVMHRIFEKTDNLPDYLRLKNGPSFEEWSLVGNVDSIADTETYEIVYISPFAFPFPRMIGLAACLENSAGMRYQSLITPTEIELNRVHFFDEKNEEVKGIIKVDGSAEVDFEDFLGFVEAFGTNLCSSRYNPQADLDENGKIDMDDFFILADNFNRKYIKN